MLVLSRKRGQSIRVASEITITVRQISGSRVVLGVEAPDDVRIVRAERRPADLDTESLQPAAAGAPGGDVA